jgi:hypothetical protein
MIPVSIIFLSSFKYNGIHKLIVDLIYSLMTQSYPGALPFFRFGREDSKCSSWVKGEIFNYRQYFLLTRAN